jgi:predicted nucleotidyltransferase
MIRNGFGDKIRQRRKEKGLPLRKVAAFIEIDPSLLSKIERGKYVLPVEMIGPLAEILDLNDQKLKLLYWNERILGLLEGDPQAEAILKSALDNIRSKSVREVSLEKLYEKLAKYFDDQPVEKVWVFGSFAREEQHETSDLDLLVRFEQPNDIDLFDYVGIKQDLEDITGRSVDLVEEGQEDDRISENIHAEKKLIYAKEAIGA